MFSKRDFQDWGKNNVVLFVSVMTKIEGRKDDDLLRTYGFGGFPSMALLDAQGEAVATKIPRDLYSMRKIVAVAPVFAKLSAAVEAGEEVDEAAWFLARLGMGEVDLEEAKAKLAAGDLTGEALKDTETAVFMLEMSALQGRLRKPGISAEEREKAVQQVRAAVYEAFKRGGRLPAGVAIEPFVDDMLIAEAKENEDAEAFFYSYERVRAKMIQRTKTYEYYRDRMGADLEKAKGDEGQVASIRQRIERIEQFTKKVEQEIADLDEVAKKLKRD